MKIAEIREALVGTDIREFDKVECGDANMVIFVTKNIIQDVTLTTRDLIEVRDYVSNEILIPNLTPSKPVDETPAKAELTTEEYLGTQASSLSGEVVLGIAFMTKVIKMDIPVDRKLKLKLDGLLISSASFEKQPYHTIEGSRNPFGVRRVVSAPNDFRVEYKTFMNHTLGIINRHNITTPSLIQNIPYFEGYNVNNSLSSVPMDDVSDLHRQYTQFIADEMDYEFMNGKVRAELLRRLFNGFSAFQDFNLKQLVLESSTDGKVKGNSVIGVIMSDENLRVRDMEKLEFKHYLKDNKMSSLDDLKDFIMGCVLMSYSVLGAIKRFQQREHRDIILTLDGQGLIVSIALTEGKSGYSYDNKFYELDSFTFELSGFMKNFVKRSTEQSFKDGKAVVVTPERSMFTGVNEDVGISTLFYITYKGLICGPKPHISEYNSFANVFPDERPIVVKRDGVLYGLIFGDIIS